MKITINTCGKEEGLIPCGLGARDTLRMEAAMPLYGHEMNDEISPLETGLGFALKITKEDFIGKHHILSWFVNVDKITVLPTVCEQSSEKHPFVFL